MGNNCYFPLFLRANPLSLPWTLKLLFEPFKGPQITSCVTSGPMYTARCSRRSVGWGGEGSCPLTPSRTADAIIDCSFVENTFILIGRKIVGARAPPCPPCRSPCIALMHQFQVGYNLFFLGQSNIKTMAILQLQLFFFTADSAKLEGIYCQFQISEKLLGVFWNFSLVTDEYPTLDQYSDLEAVINISMRYSFFAGSSRQTESSWKRNRIL